MLVWLHYHHRPLCSQYWTFPNPGKTSKNRVCNSPTAPEMMSQAIWDYNPWAANRKMVVRSDSRVIVIYNWLAEPSDWWPGRGDGAGRRIQSRYDCNAGGRKSLTNSLQLTQLSRHRPVRYAREDLQPKELKTLEDGRGAVSRVVWQVDDQCPGSCPQYNDAVLGLSAHHRWWLSQHERETGLDTSPPHSLPAHHWIHCAGSDKSCKISRLQVVRLLLVQTGKILEYFSMWEPAHYITTEPLW